MTMFDAHLLALRLAAKRRAARRPVGAARYGSAKRQTRRPRQTPRAILAPMIATCDRNPANPRYTAVRKALVELLPRWEAKEGGR